MVVMTAAPGSCLLEVNGTSHPKWVCVQIENGPVKPLEGVLHHGLKVP